MFGGKKEAQVRQTKDRELFYSVWFSNGDISDIKGNTIEEILEYYDNKFDLSNWRCIQPWSTMRISPYGDVFPCLNFNIGNIRGQKPANLWDSAHYREFRRTLARSTLFEACAGCCKMIRK